MTTWQQFKLAQATCERGGWAQTTRAPRKEDLRRAERRWTHRSFRPGEQGAWNCAFQTSLACWMRRVDIDETGDEKKGKGAK